MIAGVNSARQNILVLTLLQSTFPEFHCAHSGPPFRYGTIIPPGSSAG